MNELDPDVKRQNDDHFGFGFAVGVVVFLVVFVIGLAWQDIDGNLERQSPAQTWKYQIAQEYAKDHLTVMEALVESMQDNTLSHAEFDEIVQAHQQFTLQKVIQNAEGTNSGGYSPTGGTVGRIEAGCDSE